MFQMPPRLAKTIMYMYTYTFETEYSSAILTWLEMSVNTQATIPMQL